MSLPRPPISGHTRAKGNSGAATVIHFFPHYQGEVSFSSYPAQLSSWPGLCRIDATHAVDAQSKKQSRNKWKKWKNVEQNTERKRKRNGSEGHHRHSKNKTFHIDEVAELKIKNSMLAKTTNVTIVDAVAALHTDAEKKPILVIGKPPWNGITSFGLLRARWVGEGAGKSRCKKRFYACW